MDVPVTPAEILPAAPVAASERSQARRETARLLFRRPGISS
jgi:hypothetical protein